MRDAKGFSLLEVLVGSALVTGALLALAQLVVMAATASGRARAGTASAMFADQKLEQLRSLRYGYDELGLPVTDGATNTGVSPEAGGGGPGLAWSPPDALRRNTPGYCDFLDAAGNVLPSVDGEVPAGTVYVRRWSIGPLPSQPDTAMVVQVMVGLLRDAGDGTREMRGAEVAHLVTVRARTTW